LGEVCGLNPVLVDFNANGFACGLQVTIRFASDIVSLTAFACTASNQGDSKNNQIVKDQKVKLPYWALYQLGFLGRSFAGLLLNTHLRHRLNQVVLRQLNMPLVYHKYRHLSRGIMTKIVQIGEIF
jgi:hypothetical protein